MASKRSELTTTAWIQNESKPTCISGSRELRLLHKKRPSNQSPTNSKDLNAFSMRFERVEQ